MNKRLWPLAVALMPVTAAALAQEQADLAKASQNPVAAMISVPFQNNTLFGAGPDDDIANVLNIQPVIPVNLGPVNLINRTIVPLIYLPDLTNGLAEVPEGAPGGSEFGLGDINYTGWVSPVDSGPVTFGIAPRSACRPRPTICSAASSGVRARPRSQWRSPAASCSAA